MLEILGCLSQQHDTNLVFAALAICAFACITARVMILRSRAASGRLAKSWALAAGLVTGAGVWATHFIAMLAFTPGLPIRYDLALTALSAGIALIVPVIAAAISFTRAGGVVAGLVFSAGVIVMHYVGIAAIDMSAVEVWNPQIVLGSAIVSFALGGLAGHVSLMRVSWFTNVFSTAMRIGAILVAHFGSMAALKLVPTAMTLRPEHLTISPTIVSLLVMAATSFVVGQALIVAVVDWHLHGKAQKDAAKLRAYISELEATKESLERASEAAEAGSLSKSAFLASMSHELRTPLNAMLGFTEMVLSEPFGAIGNTKYKEYLGDAHTSGKHLLDLINDILDIARFDAGHAELVEGVFDPAMKIQDVVRMMSGQARTAQIELKTVLRGTLPYLNADRRRIRQILLNLISNALKFTEAGGSVTVEAWVDDGFHFQVRDTGIGIPPNEFSKALEPFGQVDSTLARKYEGTGLGLPLTRQMAELHGGTLNLESTLGVGTTVTVSLPRWRIVDFEGNEVAA